MPHMKIKRFSQTIIKGSHSVKMCHAAQQYKTMDYVEGRGYTPHPSLLPTKQYKGTGDHSPVQKLILQCI